MAYLHDKSFSLRFSLSFYIYSPKKKFFIVFIVYNYYIIVFIVGCGVCHPHVRFKIADLYIIDTVKNTDRYKEE